MWKNDGSNAQQNRNSSIFDTKLAKNTITIKGEKYNFLLSLNSKINRINV